MTKDEIVGVWQGSVRALARSLHRKYPGVEVGDIEGEAWVWLYSQAEPGIGLWRYLEKHVHRAVVEEIETRGRLAGPSPVGVDWADSEFILLVKAAMHFPFVNPQYVRDNVRSEWQPVVKRVEKALEQLNEEERELLELRYYEEEPVRAVCQKYGVSRATISRRARQALDRAREIFDQDQDTGDRQYVGQSLIVSNSSANRPNQNTYPVHVKSRRHGRARIED